MNITKVWAERAQDGRQALLLHVTTDTDEQVTLVFEGRAWSDLKEVVNPTRNP
jgi:hypothetical protein